MGGLSRDRPRFYGWMYDGVLLGQSMSTIGDMVLWILPYRFV